MRTTAAVRQAPDLTSKPRSLDWLVYCREYKLLTASEWALAAILVTLGQGQNIMLTVTGMADVTRMTRKTVAKAIDGLVAKGLMVVKATGRNNAVVYRLTLPSRVNETQQLSRSDPAAESMATSSRVNETHNIEHEDEDADEANINMRSAQHDDVASTATPSGENRAKGSARATKAPSASTTCRTLKEYVSDLEGCRDELARRLCVDPGNVTVKPLARMFRDMCVAHGEDVVLSELLDNLCPETDTIWPMAAGKDNPVGFLKFALEQRLGGNDVTQFYRAPAGAPVEIDPRVLADKVADVALAKGYVYHFQGGDFGVDQDALVEAMKLLEGDDRFNVHESYGKGRGGWRVDLRMP